MAMAAVGDLVAPRERGRYQGYIAATFAVATIVGPLIGGVLVDHASWRWVFLVNLPIGAAALAAPAPAPAGAGGRWRRPPARRVGRRATGRRDQRSDADLHLGRGALRVGLGGDPRADRRDRRPVRRPGRARAPRRRPDRPLPPAAHRAGGHRQRRAVPGDRGAVLGHRLRAAVPGDDDGREPDRRRPAAGSRPCSASRCRPRCRAARSCAPGATSASRSRAWR